MVKNMADGSLKDKMLSGVNRRPPEELLDSNALDNGVGDEEMEELRRLLLGSRDDYVADLQERLDHIAELKEKGQLEAVSRELPKAISLHNPNNTPLVNALSPTIEKTLKVSIRRNPQPFVDALFPAIGPAIRRSIHEALKSVMDSMNRTMEHSLSPQSIKWRIEAARTGRLFSEVVLAHTLNYRVEQLFLIDRKTGLPIQHLFADSVEVKDSDVITSMLSAIQDFVRDSLGAKRDDVVGSLEVGELNILVEPGPRAILAAVVRGIPTAELRDTMKQIIEAVHLQFSYLLDTFDGDPGPFSTLRPLLRTGFLSQYKPQDRQTNWTWLLIGLLSLIFVIWAVLSTRNYMMWREYVADLKTEPGILVTETGWWNGRWIVEGMVDPMAPDPNSMVPSGIPTDRIIGHWEPYLALDNNMVLRRANLRLNAPQSISFELHDDTLVANGTATPMWVSQARLRAENIAGVAVFDDSRVTLQENNQLLDIIDAIERSTITFDQGSSAIPFEQGVFLEELVLHIEDLSAQSNQEGLQFRVHIVGYASTEGASIANRILSQQRAESVRTALIGRGVDPDATIAMGTGNPLKPGLELSEADRELNRSAKFQVVQF